MDIIVRYEGFDKELDELLTKAMTEVGLQWLSQDFDYLSKERIICFEWKGEKE